MLLVPQCLEGVVAVVGFVGEDWAEGGLEMVVEDNRVQNKAHFDYKTVGLVVAGVSVDVRGSPAEDNLVECLD